MRLQKKKLQIQPERVSYETRLHKPTCAANATVESLFITNGSVFDIQGMHDVYDYV